MDTFSSHRFYWYFELQRYSIEVVAGRQVTGTQAVGEGIADSPDCRRDGVEDIGFVGVDTVGVDTVEVDIGGFAAVEDIADFVEVG